MSCGIYKDCIKGPKDLLGKGYDLNTKKLQIKSKSADGVSITADGEIASAVLGSLAFKTSCDNFSLDKLSVSSHGRFNLEASTTSLVDNVKFSLKAEDGLAGKDMKNKSYSSVGTIGLEYKIDSCATDAVIDIINGPSVTVSSLGKYENFLLGGTVAVDTGLDAGTGFAVTDFGGCIGYATKDFSAVVQSSKKCKNHSLNILHKVDGDTTIGSQATFNGTATTLAVGGSYKVNGETTLQAKVNEKADVTASLKQDVGALTFTLATSVNAVSLADPKFGMNFVLSL
jgi:hypothetical protein